MIEKKEDFYEYFVRGRLEERKGKIVCVGELQIDISIDISEAYILIDICIGDMIEFTVSRLDIY